MDHPAAAAHVAPTTRHHLDEMTESLEAEFGERFTREEIERVMADSIERLAGQAQVEQFLPVLAHRFTRERLMALSRRARPAAEGSLDVVFVSLTGGGRSQIAAALTTWLSDGAVSVHAAGTGAQQPLDDGVATAIQELGIDIAESFARPASPEVLEAADVIVTMGHSVGQVAIPEGARHVDWRVGDPNGADLDETRRVRDDIERRVRALLDEHGIAAVERNPVDARFGRDEG